MSTLSDRNTPLPRQQCSPPLQQAQCTNQIQASSPMEGTLNGLHAELNDIEHAVSTLEMRLVTVTEPAAPVPPSTTGGASNSADPVPVISAVANAATRVASLRLRIHDLLARLHV